MVGRKNNNKYILSLVILLLAGMFFLEFTSSLKESQTVDEGTHLASGYSYLKTGDFRMNPEHPPLIKELAAFPLLFLKLKLPLEHESWRNYNQWEFARQFLYHNTKDADFILLLGRIPVMLLSLILGIFIYKWSNKLWGPKIALFSLTLFVFEPNILAHSRYITTDLGITLFFFLTLYCLDNYLKTFSRKDLTVFIIIYSLTQTVKFSSLILLPLIILFLILRKFHSSSNQLSVRRILFIIFSLIILSLIFIFGFYGLETKRAIEDPEVKNFYEEQLKVTSPSEFSSDSDFIKTFKSITLPTTSFGDLLYTLAQKLTIPAFSYFKGVGKLISHSYWGHLSYLLDSYSNAGFWYYFPILFLIKTPLPLLFLLIISGAYFFLKLISILFNPANRKIIRSTLYERIIYFYRSQPFSYWIIFLSGVIYFFWAMTSKINIGLRHILPIYPLVIILSVGVIKLKPKRFTKFWQGLTIFLVLYYISSTLFLYPNFLAYFNEITGGPENGPKYAVDSNIDWGQDLLKLKDYLTENKISSIYLTYFGSLDVNYYNIDFKSVPTDRDYQERKKLDGVVVISVTALYEEERPYHWLEKLVPDEKIGYSLYLYDLRK